VGHKFERIRTYITVAHIKKSPGTDQTYEKTSVTIVSLKFLDPNQIFSESTSHTLLIYPVWPIANFTSTAVCLANRNLLEKLTSVLQLQRLF
jgi:hypothetical protein